MTRSSETRESDSLSVEEVLPFMRVNGIAVSVAVYKGISGLTDERGNTAAAYFTYLASIRDVTTILAPQRRR